MMNYFITIIIISFLISLPIDVFSQNRYQLQSDKQIIDWFKSISNQTYSPFLLKPKLYSSDYIQLLNSINMESLNDINKEIYLRHKAIYDPSKDSLPSDLKFFSPGLKYLFWNPQNGYSWITYKSNTFNFKIFPILGLEWNRFDENFLKGTNLFEKHNYQGFSVVGNFYEEVSFHVKFVDHQGVLRYKPSTKRTTLPGYGFVKNDNDRSVDFNEVRVSIAFPFAFGIMEIGKDTPFWGFGGESVILGKSVSPYPYISWYIPFDEKFAYEMVWGELTHFVGQNKDVLTERKSINAHRLVFLPTQHWRLSLFESVVYHDRSVDPLYLVPFAFLRGQEHYAGSPDNANLGFSIEWMPNNHWFFGYQFLIDDLSVEKIGTDFERNKFANLLGFGWYSQLFDRPISIESTFSYKSENTYIHRDSVNNYEHYGDWIGLGLNSKNIQFEIAYTLFPSLSFLFSNYQNSFNSLRYITDSVAFFSIIYNPVKNVKFNFSNNYNKISSNYTIKIIIDI